MLLTCLGYFFSSSTHFLRFPALVDNEDLVYQDCESEHEEKRELYINESESQVSVFILLRRLSAWHDELTAAVEESGRSKQSTSDRRSMTD